MSFLVAGWWQFVRDWGLRIEWGDTLTPETGDPEWAGLLQSPGSHSVQLNSSILAPLSVGQCPHLHPTDLRTRYPGETYKKTHHSIKADRLLYIMLYDKTFFAWELKWWSGSKTRLPIVPWPESDRCLSGLGQPMRGPGFNARPMRGSDTPSVMSLGPSNWCESESGWRGFIILYPRPGPRPGSLLASV